MMATSNIPLKCTICPKKPKFSDVSHLLTHVASKGHLSHYYKVKVRSSTDQVSRDMIETYDNWYSDWRVEKLMSQRMHVKDRRRINKGRNQDPPQKPRQSQPSIDPQLKELRQLNANATQISMDDISGEPDLESFLNVPPHLKKHKPRLHLWSTMRPSSIDSVALEWSSPETQSHPPSRHSIDNIVPMAYMGGQAAVVAHDEEDDEGIVAEATKLKGIFWPGMDLFDAATPDMKRKRNQKKDVSVVEQLEHSSLMVEPTEMIFTPQGSLKKERLISGQVEIDSSPYKLDIPSPPRRRATRKPLVEQDPNALSVLLLPDPLSRYYIPATNILESGDDAGMKKRGKQRRNFVVYQDEPEDPFYEPAQMKCHSSVQHPLQEMTASNLNETAYFTNSPSHEQTLFGSSRVSFAAQSTALDSCFFDLPYYGMQSLRSCSPAPLPPYEHFFPPSRTNKPVPPQMKPLKDEFDDSLTILISSDK